MLKGLLDQALQWVSVETATQPPDDFYCQTRDVFQARLDTLRILLEREQSFKDIAPLLTAITGEIGNNSFDHNSGNWRDIAGIYFQYDIQGRMIVCADRGQGIRATLQKVRPAIALDEDALRVAFTERISGRAPEKRGNGLKFVRAVVAQQQWHLTLRSGEAEAVVNEQFVIQKSTPSLHGCVVSIHF